MLCLVVKKKYEFWLFGENVGQGMLQASTSLNLTELGYETNPQRTNFELICSTLNEAPHRSFPQTVLHFPPHSPRSSAFLPLYTFTQLPLPYHPRPTQYNQFSKK